MNRRETAPQGRGAGTWCGAGTALSVALGATAAWASGGEGAAGGSWLDFGWRTVNFVILVGALYWLLARKIREFFTGRRAGIQASLAAAAAAKEEAEKRYREYSAKLDKATEEIQGIHDMITSQGMAEKERILAEAQMAAEKLREDTQARLEQELKKARDQLRLDAVQLSVDMAEEILRRQITPQDHEGMVKDYVEKVVTKH